MRVWGGIMNKLQNGDSNIGWDGTGQDGDDGREQSSVLTDGHHHQCAWAKKL